MFLADQGAEVIKIEPLGGDITRRSRQSISASGEFSALFVSTNRRFLYHSSKSAGSGTDGSQTLSWREVDSNFRFRAR